MKTAIITGATTGIGFETAKQLAQKGYKIIHLARNEEKAKKADAVLLKVAGHQNISHIYCDLADLSTVKTAAEQLKETSRRIDVLINNAGGIVDTDERTVDGIEETFAINHLGHFYLTTLLINELTGSKARVINVSSEAHRIGFVNPEAIKKNKGLNKGLKGYGDAKLCNILFGLELHKRYGERGLTAYSLHPGAVRTSFGSNMKGWLSGVLKFSQLFMITPSKGAATSVYLATEEGLDSYSGGYFKRKRPSEPSGQAVNYAKAARLWEVSEEMIDEVMKK